MSKKSDRKIQYLATPAKLIVHLCGETLQAEGGILHLAPEHEEELKELIAGGRVDLSQSLKKIDMANVEAVIHDHQDKLGELNKPPVAINGPVTSHNQAADKIREVDIKQNSDLIRAGKTETVLTGMAKLRAEVGRG